MPQVRQEPQDKLVDQAALDQQGRSDVPVNRAREARPDHQEREACPVQRDHPDNPVLQEPRESAVSEDQPDQWDPLVLRDNRVNAENVVHQAPPAPLVALVKPVSVDLQVQPVNQEHAAVMVRPAKLGQLVH